MDDVLPSSKFEALDTLETSEVKFPESIYPVSIDLSFKFPESQKYWSGSMGVSTVSPSVIEKLSVGVKVLNQACTVFDNESLVVTLSFGENM